MAERKKALKELIENLDEGLDTEEAKKLFKDLINETGPDDLARVEEELVKEGMPRENLSKLCDIHLAVFKEQLSQEKIIVPIGHPINILMEEHRLVLEFTEKLNFIASTIAKISERKFDKITQQLKELHDIAQHFKEAIKHYLREENVLFPYIEKHGLTEPPAQMWIDHDKIRSLESEFFSLLDSAENKVISYDDFSENLLKSVGTLAGILTSHYFKENNILFPASLRLVTNDEWIDIRKEFDEIGYCCFTPKEATNTLDVEIDRKEEKIPEEIMMNGMIEFETGPLPMSFIEPIFNTLPVDITFVDDEDKVRYFSKGAERIFVRTKAIIGRSVINCHPKKSYHVVNQILTDFKEGKRKIAEFWIELNERKIHIRYFAVHDKEGKYLGCLEVSQDITEIQQLKGQKRLLD